METCPSAKRDQKLADLANEALEKRTSPKELKDALQQWLDNFDDGEKSRAAGNQLVEAIEVELANAEEYDGRAPRYT